MQKLSSGWRGIEVKIFFVLLSFKIPDTKAYSVHWQNDLVEKGKRDIGGKQQQKNQGPE